MTECSAIDRRCSTAKDAFEDYVCTSRAREVAGLSCYEPSEPTAFPAFWTSSLVKWAGTTLALCAATFVVLVLLIALLRVFMSERHAGWKRLAILSPAFGFAGGWAYGWSEYESVRAEVLAASLAGALFSFALFVFGRGLTLWVLEGFGRSARSNSQANTPAQMPAAENQSAASEANPKFSGKTGKRLAIAAVIGLAMLVNFVVNPARALETTLGALFTVAGLVVVVYVFRRISEAIDYLRA